MIASRIGVIAIVYLMFSCLEGGVHAFEFAHLRCVVLGYSDNPCRAGGSGGGRRAVAVDLHR
jgi:hypothetical protein